MILFWFAVIGVMSLITLGISYRQWGWDGIWAVSVALVAGMLLVIALAWIASP